MPSQMCNYTTRGAHRPAPGSLLTLFFRLTWVYIKWTMLIECRNIFCRLFEIFFFLLCVLNFWLLVSTQSPCIDFHYRTKDHKHSVLVSSLVQISLDQVNPLPNFTSERLSFSGMLFSYIMLLINLMCWAPNFFLDCTNLQHFAVYCCPCNDSFVTFYWHQTQNELM